MGRTIVVPLIGAYLDADRGEEWVLPVVSVLANRTKAKVLLVSVVDVGSEKRSAVSVFREPVLSEKEVSRLVASRRQFLTQVGARFPGIDVDTEIRIGRPVDEILAVLARLEQATLVMATHGRVGISGLLYDSVALNVLHGACCPVVLLSEAVKDSWSPHAVIVALDGSIFAEVALESTLEMLGVEHLSLHLVHSIDYISGEDLPSTKRRVASYLDKVTSRLIARGASVEWEIRTGAAAQELIRAAEERGAGLIAMATHGRSGLGRFFLGSVAERVVHQSPVPVLLVRPDPQSVARLEAERQVEPPLWRTVRDIMAQPLVTVREDATLEEVAHTMLKHRVGSMPVVDQDGRLTGMLTGTDFSIREKSIPFTDVTALSLFGYWVPGEDVEHIYALGRTIRARELMSCPVVTATEQETVSAVVARMRKHRITHIPVLRKGLPVGMVSRHDLLKLMVLRSNDVAERR